MSAFIYPPSARVADALDGWKWLDLAGKVPVLVTAFADVFLQASDGIWFLDTYEGKLKKICETKEQLHDLLHTEKAQDLYLFAPFVQRAISEGMALTEEECYDFKLHPVVGGALEMENIEKRSFLVALHLRGQLHEQVRHLPPGTKINSFKLVEAAPTHAPQKSWWKLW